MPKKVAAKKRKTGTRKSKKTKTRKVNIFNRVGGFPDYLVTKVRYQENYYTNLGASSTVYYKYNSGIFDPRYAVGGHQPMYHDQYSQIYTNYTVLGFWYNIKYLSTSNGTSTLPLTLNLYTRKAAGNETDTETASERRTDRQWLVPGGQKPLIIKGYVDVAKVWNVTKSEIWNDPDYTGETEWANVAPSYTAGTNPAKMAFLTLMIQNSWALSAEYAIIIELTYKVKYHGTVYVAKS